MMVSKHQSNNKVLPRLFELGANVPWSDGSHGFHCVDLTVGVWVTVAAIEELSVTVTLFASVLVELLGVPVMLFSVTLLDVGVVSMAVAFVSTDVFVKDSVVLSDNEVVALIDGCIVVPFLVSVVLLFGVVVTVVSSVKFEGVDVKFVSSVVFGGIVVTFVPSEKFEGVVVTFVAAKVPVVFGD